VTKTDRDLSALACVASVLAAVRFHGSGAAHDHHSEPPERLRAKSHPPRAPSDFPRIHSVCYGELRFIIFKRSHASSTEARPMPVHAILYLRSPQKSAQSPGPKTCGSCPRMRLQAAFTILANNQPQTQIQSQAARPFMLPAIPTELILARPVAFG
jgi:hypothetical protein